MRIALIGTRGVPAAYGGFETAAEEIGARLVQRGHEVMVTSRGGHTVPSVYRGMEVIPVHAVRTKHLDTVTSTALALAAVKPRSVDAGVVFNVGNALALRLMPRHFRHRFALHLDGIEWARAKWGSLAKAYFRVQERIATSDGVALIADAEAISSYYRSRYQRVPEVLSYGAPILMASDVGEPPLGLARRRYHLVVARLEPENNVHLAVRAYVRSSCQWPLLVIGGGTHSARYQQELRRFSGTRPVIWYGPEYEQDRLNAAYVHAGSYIHGHSVGGTNPSLLRAMGAGGLILAHDNMYNREVCPDAWFFKDEEDLEGHLAAAEAGSDCDVVRQQSRERVRAHYNWDRVADGYEDLLTNLALAK